MPGNKTRYLNFCQIHPLPLHAQPWWLDAVCGPEHWDVALTENAAGEITGSWPYYLTRRAGLRIIRPAPLTSYGGPRLQYPANPDLKLPSRYEFEQKTCAALLRQLPDTAFFRQNLYPEVTNGLPFRWAGYHLDTRYTYRFDLPANDWPERMDSGTRNKIRQADRQFEIDPSGQLADFGALYRAADGRRKWPSPPQENVERLDRAAQAQQARHIFLARRRDNGQPQAALYITCDRQRAYCLFSAFRPETPLNQANYLLYDAVLRFCAGRGLGFDFEGSLDPGVGHVFRKMGGRLVPYLQIWKGRKWLEVMEVGIRNRR